MNDQLAIFGGEPSVTIEREFKYPIITDVEINAVTDLLRQGMVSDAGYSDVVRLFEEEWAAYLEIEFALSRIDGSAALHSACFAAGVGLGDEVIVQSYTWIATVGAIVAAGGIPVFADIDPTSLTLDPADVERRITPRTKAIMVVHLWGHPAAMDEIMAIAEKHDLVVIEDASHAHGALYKGRRIGTIGDIGCFSMQATKALPAGEGGILITREREYFERALLLAQSPARLNMHLQMEEHRRFRNTGFGGFKYRINPLNAAMARCQLPHLEERNLIRQKNLDFLSEQLSDVSGIVTPRTAGHVTRGGYYAFPIEYKSGELNDLSIDLFVKALNAEGVPLNPERYPMLHLEPMFAEHNPIGGGFPWNYSDETRAVTYKPGDLPVTEEIYPRLLSLAAYDKVTPCEDLFEQWGNAFRKVTRKIEQLQALAHESRPKLNAA